MTDRLPPPPPPRPVAADQRRLPWLKIGIAAVVALVLLAIANALFGNAMGAPDEARRARHPAGFSICTPLGWDSTIYQRDSRGTDTIRLAPERSTGRQTILQATRFGDKPKLAPTATDTTFQGRPAFREIANTHYDWVWQVTFERDGAWYHVQITSPIELDPASDPLVAFANSFRTEPIVKLQAPPTTSATSQP